MIINYLKQGEIRYAILMVVAVVAAMTVHEFAHAYAAHKCGDDTAYAFGRMTLNPLKHIDWFGFAAMLLMGFGWAKPVPVNMRGLRKPRRDIAIVAFAGPASNFILAFLCVGFMRLLFLLMSSGVVSFGSSTFGGKLFDSFYFLFAISAILNVGLGLFNLIPLPPLDGSKVLSSLLPHKWSARYLMLERYAPIIMVVIIALSYMDVLSPIFYPLEWLRDKILYVFSLPYVFGAYAYFLPW
ncbi:MAG: site-2 protease family protein [Clostridia bacterium]|nr:site-2 protease family protein [Clostridia bacterium]